MVVVDNNKIFITKGDSAEFEVVIMDGEQEYDYSNDTVEFGVKRSAFDESCVIRKTVNEDGKIVLTPEDTDIDYGDYIYDVQVTHMDDSGEEPVTYVYTPIAAQKFTIGYSVL